MNGSFNAFGSSDHYPVWTDIIDKAACRASQPLQASLAVWKPDSEESAEQFREEIVDTMGLTDTSRLDLHTAPGLREIAAGIEGVARRTKHSTNLSRRRSLQSKPSALLEAERSSQQAAQGELKKKCRRLEAKLQRKWLAEKCLHGRPRPRKPLAKLECDGRLTEDREAWCKCLRSHCISKYHDESETAEVQKMRVAALRSVQANSEMDGLPAPELTAGITLQARGRLKSGKCCGGGENIVADMLMLLPINAVCLISEIFAARYKGHDREVDAEAWRTVLRIFLPKVGHPTHLQHFRGISLLSMMSKWYMQCLYIMASACPKPFMGPYMALQCFIRPYRALRRKQGLAIKSFSKAL